MTTKERIFILNKAELNSLRMTKENSKFMDIGDHSHGLDSLLKDDQKIKTVINLPASSFRTSAHQSPAKLDARKKHTFLRKKHSKTTPIPLLNSPLTPKAQNIKQPSPTSRAQSAAETIKLSRESTPLSAEKEKPKTESQPIIGAPRPRQQKRLDKLEPKPLHNNITKTPSRSFIIKHKKGDSFENQKIIVNTNVSNDNMHDKIEIVGSKIGINELTPPPKKMCNYSPKPISEERKSDNSSLASYKNLSKDDSNNSKIEETILSQSKVEVSNIEQDSSGEGNYPKRKTRPRKELTNVVLKKDDMINSEVRIGGMIGEGAYGRVFEAFNLDTGNFIAVKVMDLEEDQQKPSINIQNLCAEIEVYQKLDHENIVRYLGAKQEKDTAYIYMEYMPGGSIYSMLKQYGPFEEQVIQKFTRQVALGLDYLHSMGVIHRDIKGANILSDGNGNVKLADFGAAKHIDYLPFIASTSSSDLCSSIKGSLYWMAPELLDQKKHGRKIDIWSLGCTVIEMATASHPWPDVKNFTDLVMTLMMRKCPPIPDNLSDCAKDFIKQCCQFDPKLRPKIRSLLEHPFIKSSNTS